MALNKKWKIVSKLITTPRAKKTNAVIKKGEITCTNIPDRVLAKKYAVGEYM
jgi:hypothetical protein